MKSSRIVLLLGLLPVLGACAPMNGETCPLRHVSLIAKTGGERAPTILKIAPDTIVVKEGCSFEVRFANGKSVSTNGGTETWLTEGPQSVSPIIIAAPSDKGGKTYKYTIDVAGFGTLDPRARITH